MKLTQWMGVYFITLIAEHFNYQAGTFYAFVKCSFHSLLVGLFVERESEYSHQKLGAGPDRAFQSKREENVTHPHHP